MPGPAPVLDLHSCSLVAWTFVCCKPRVTASIRAMNERLSRLITVVTIAGLIVALGATISALLGEQRHSADLRVSLESETSIVADLEQQVRDQEASLSWLRGRVTRLQQEYDECSENLASEIQDDVDSSAPSLLVSEKEALVAVPSSNASSQPTSEGTSTQSSAPDTSTRRTLRDFEGTYRASANGVEIRLTIYDADDDTAYGTLYSTNAGMSSCAIAFLGNSILLGFSDLSELRLSIISTRSLRFTDSGIVVRR